jgi:hypothetical protein
MGLESQFMAITGRCVCCGDMTKVCNATTSPDICSGPPLGVCDLCAYALGHAWRRELGQLVRATTPKIARTYVLVSRLPKGRSETDIASYELLVDAEGGLPKSSFLKPGKLCTWLREAFGCETWESFLRPCYLGYAASGDFSEVLFARAWGKIPGTLAKARFATFGELLSKPTPDAGFHLGVKAAFENLLWRKEVAPEEGALCTVMREPAMRYLFAQCKGQHGDEEDLAMVEMYRTMMTADELEVARLALEGPRASGLDNVNVESEGRQENAKPDVKVDDDGGEAATDEPGFFEGGELSAAAGDIPEGFARPPRSMP